MGQGDWVGREGGGWGGDPLLFVLYYSLRNCSPELGNALRIPAPAARARPLPIIGFLDFPFSVKSLRADTWSAGSNVCVYAEQPHALSP